MKKDKTPMTPEQRKLWAQMGAYALLAKYDSRETTRAALRAIHVTRYERIVDPEGILPPEDRQRRVEAARKSHMRGLALKHSQSASARKADTGRGTGLQPPGAERS